MIPENIIVKWTFEGIKYEFPIIFPRQDSAPCGNRSPQESHGGLGSKQSETSSLWLKELEWKISVRLQLLHVRGPLFIPVGSNRLRAWVVTQALPGSRALRI